MTLLIGAIPVALPAVLTIVQAAGALTLSKRGVLVAKVDSIEDAASIDTFCFDKTGTITQNRLTLTDSRTFDGTSEDDLLSLAALASSASGMDAIDMAILDAFGRRGLPGRGDQLAYVPFSPESKRTEADVVFDGQPVRIIKGAVQTVLALCGDSATPLRAGVEQAVQGFSDRGIRAIAVATRPEGAEDHRLRGLLGLSDPPRDDSAGIIADLNALGITTKMITGDSVAIAREVAGQVGIGDKILGASRLRAADPEAQAQLIADSDGFTEVFPEDKYRIVRLLQGGGHLVGMTGDGVNDAPALKQAELGTAVSEATDIAKASASIILTQPGLSAIKEAIVVSRMTYQRMLTWVINKIVKVVEVALLHVISFFWLQQGLISLLGMSLLILANDFATMSIATDSVKSTSSPNFWQTRSVTLASLLIGLLFVVADLTILGVGVYAFKLPFPQVQTLMLLTLVFNSQFRLLLVRERNHWYSSAPSRFLLTVCIVTIAAFALLGLVGDLTAALTWWQIAATLGFTMAAALLIDAVKYRVFRAMHIG